MDDNILNHVSSVTHARSLWTKLEELYAINTGNNKLFLYKQFMSLRYSDVSSMTNHLNTFQGLWLFGTLSNSWKTFIT